MIAKLGEFSQMFTYIRPAMGILPFFVSEQVCLHAHLPTQARSPDQVNASDLEQESEL